METESNVWSVDLPRNGRGHEPDGPFVDAEEEDAVVETVVVVCDEGVDV